MPNEIPFSPYSRCREFIPMTASICIVPVFLPAKSANMESGALVCITVVNPQAEQA